MKSDKVTFCCFGVLHEISGPLYNLSDVTTSFIQGAILLDAAQKLDQAVADVLVRGERETIPLRVLRQHTYDLDPRKKILKSYKSI